MQSMIGDYKKAKHDEQMQKAKELLLKIGVDEVLTYDQKNIINSLFTRMFACQIRIEYANFNLCTSKQRTEI